MKKINIAIADDQNISRQSLAILINSILWGITLRYSKGERKGLYVNVLTSIHNRYCIVRDSQRTVLRQATHDIFHKLNPSCHCEHSVAISSLCIGGNAQRGDCHVASCLTAGRLLAMTNWFKYISSHL